MKRSDELLEDIDRIDSITRQLKNIKNVSMQPIIDMLASGRQVLTDKLGFEYAKESLPLPKAR